MPDQVWVKIAENGIFAIMFVVLLLWVLKNNDDREKRYMDFIQKMADKLDLLNVIADTLKALKQDLDDLHDKIDRIEREMWKTGKGGEDDEP